MENKTKILWLSRHNMTQEQRSDLERIYGDVEIISCDKTVASYRDVLEAGKDCDVLAVVLPPAILADLTNPRNNKKPVIRAIAKRVPTGATVFNPATRRNETEYCFEHEAWEKVIKIEVVTERL